LTAIIERRVDVAVVGAGPAGVAAARAARMEGAERVVVFERDREPGGILQQCIHTGFGLHTFGLELTGPEYMHRYLELASSAGVEFNLNTTVFGMDPPVSADGRKAAICWTTNPAGGIERVTAGAVVLAMGCRERPAGALGLAGTRPSGVYTAGSAQRMVNVEGIMPGRRAVIMGTGDIGLIMARRMKLQGADVSAVFEIMPWVSGLRRNVAQCLEDFDIPYFLNSAVCELRGRDRLEGVVVADVMRDMTLAPGTERFVPCDTLLLAVGLIPENELSRMAGVAIDPTTNGPFVNSFMQTSAECVFAAGNVTVVYDLADFASREGERAGTYAARYAAGKLAAPERELKVERGSNIRLLSPCKVSAAGDATIYVRVSEPIEGRCALSASGGLFFKELLYARPGEMNEVTLTAEAMAAMPRDIDKITISVEAM
jgi:NADPH-dependent 2,4-dienoyl-CoA reductase/sulfur reductase-like enzyme